MDSINSNIASKVQNMQAAIPSVNFNPNFSVGAKQQFINDVAANMSSICDSGFKFDTIMNNIAAFKDILSVTQSGVSQMKEQGESIRDLVAQAQRECVTPELMDKIQAEVDSRVAEINRIRESANFNGFNPFNGSFQLDIPNVLELMGAKDKEEANGQIADMLASFDIDMTIEGDGFSIGGSAKIEIGYTEDGALQINVDASMDYDLSGLVGKGSVTSDGAFELINNFINMLGVQQGDLGNAQNFLDAIIEQIFNAMEGNGENMPEGVEIQPDSSNTLKGHMVQQASITLDGMAGQAPNIAINIL